MAAGISLPIGLLNIPLAVSGVGSHANVRNSPESKASVQQQLEQLTCFQLSDWEQVVLYTLKAGDDASALSTLNVNVSLPVLREDLPRIRQAMTARGCPSREQMLTAGTAPPVKGSTLNFACICWRPDGVTPIAKEGAGPAGPGCVTVRAEVAPGVLTFIENVPTWGDRRYEINRSDGLAVYDGRRRGPSVLGSLDRQTATALIRGSVRDPIPASTESDGWIEAGKGRFRLLADDCEPLSSEQALVAERTVVRWVEEP